MIKSTYLKLEIVCISARKIVIKKTNKHVSLQLIVYILRFSHSAVSPLTHVSDALFR